MKYIYKTIILTLFFIMINSAAFAQEEFPDDAKDVPAPIDQNVLPMFVLGILFGMIIFVRVNKKQKT